MFDRLQVWSRSSRRGRVHFRFGRGPDDPIEKIVELGEALSRGDIGAGAGSAATHCAQRMASLAPEDGAQGAIGMLTIAAVRACAGIAPAAAPGAATIAATRINRKSHAITGFR